MTETLLSPSNILLYGRVMVDLEFKGIPPNKNRSTTSTLRHRSRALFPRPDRRRASARTSSCRTSSTHIERTLQGNPSWRGSTASASRATTTICPSQRFSWSMAPGSDPEAWRPATTMPEARYDRAPSDTDRSGVARQATSFAEDMRVWSYDKGDYSIRLGSGDRTAGTDTAPGGTTVRTNSRPTIAGRAHSRAAECLHERPERVLARSRTQHGGLNIGSEAPRQAPADCSSVAQCRPALRRPSIKTSFSLGSLLGGTCASVRARSSGECA